MSKRGNGEGSITRYKDGRWCARYTMHTATGPKRKAIYGKTRQEVADRLARALSDRDGGLAFDARSVTLGEYLDRWLNDSVRDSVKQRTLENYAYVVRNHLAPALGHIKLKVLTPAHVQGLYRSKLDSGLSSRTVELIHTTLHKALKQAVRWALVPRNVADVSVMPSVANDSFVVRVESPTSFVVIRIL
jgi:integrase